MFTAENILERTRRHPFIPFRITTSTDFTYDVMHPDMVVALRNRLILPVLTDDGVPERSIEIAVIHVTSLTDLPAPRKVSLTDVA